MTPLRTIVAATLLLGAAPAAAEIYKCRRPDGKTVFTSDASTCPGADPHRIRGAVQTLPGSATKPSSPARVRRSPPPVDDAIQASQWRGKRQGAERELGELRSHLDEVEGLVAWCNRGGDLFVRDAAGLKQHYSCDEARSQLERMRQRMAELEFYLEDGLAEECRRAGCLPGWIR